MLLNHNRSPFLLTAALLLVLSAACGGGGSAEPAMEEADHDMEAAEPADNGAPRVHFEGLENHDTIPSLVALEFAAENFTIEPVGDGAINEGAGHYHIAIDGECLEPGIVIPTAVPWIHFGDGSNSIEIELEPGEHYLCLQIGDGEHRTLDEPGLSQYIMVHVEEEVEEGA